MSGPPLAKPITMRSPDPADVYDIVSEPFALWAFMRESESPPASEAPSTWRPNATRVSELDAERPTLIDIPRRCSSGIDR